MSPQNELTDGYHGWNVFFFFYDIFSNVYHIKQEHKPKNVYKRPQLIWVRHHSTTRLRYNQKPHTNWTRKLISQNISHHHTSSFAKRRQDQALNASPSPSLRHAEGGNEISGTEILRFGRKWKALYKTLSWEWTKLMTKVPWGKVLRGDTGSPWVRFPWGYGDALEWWRREHVTSLHTVMKEPLTSTEKRWRQSCHILRETLYLLRSPTCLRGH